MTVRKPWEREAFALPDTYARFLRYVPLAPEICKAFGDHGIALSSDCSARSCGPTKWKIRAGACVFVLRLIDESLVVSEELLPLIPSLLLIADKFFVSIRWGLTAQFRRYLKIHRALLAKRLFDRPSRLLVNVGAGVWYARGWKVLDHCGQWYKANRPLIDFEHDLARLRPMPFRDRSVHLFYSEHVFEHLPDAYCHYAFSEMYRALVVGGGLRIVVPDADLLVRRLRAGDHSFFRSLVPERPDSIVEAFLVLIAHPREYVDNAAFFDSLVSLPQQQFLNKYTKPLSYDYARAGQHINWFDFQKLRSMLIEAGFEEVSLSSPQASRFLEIRGDQFDTRPSYSLHVDASKTR